jgi:DNA-binding beta-propeller fold protein YncE
MSVPSSWVSAATAAPPDASGQQRSVAGSELWAARYGATGNDIAAAVVISPDGTKAFVTGTSSALLTDDYATVAYEVSTGVELWATNYQGLSGHSEDYATSIVVSPDGTKVFVTGRSDGTNNLWDDYATVAYETSTGAEVWVARYDGPAGLDDNAVAVAVRPDGATVFVTGRSDGGNDTTEYATVAYRSSTGAQRWARRYHGPLAKDDQARAVTVGPDGRTVFVTGTSDGDYATVAYLAGTGTQLWVARYTGLSRESIDDAEAIAMSRGGGRVFVTGRSGGAGRDDDYATVGYKASTGLELWVRRYDGPGHVNDRARSIVVSPDGATVFVSGESGGTSTGHDYATIAYNAGSGSSRWVRRFDGPASRHDEAMSVVVGPRGMKVFVTGRSRGRSSYDFATIAYLAANGSTVWVGRYGGDGSTSYDAALSAAVTPDGATVLVTGLSETNLGTVDYDYATAAYKA